MICMAYFSFLLLFSMKQVIILSPNTNLNPALENNNHCAVLLDYNVIEQPAP